MTLEELKYICGHAGNGLVPMLAMIHIYEGTESNRAQVGNGRYVVDVPCDLPPCTVHADKLAAAWAACKADPQPVLTGDFLTVKAGRVRTRIPRSDSGEYPLAFPTPITGHTAPGVAALLQRLQPFVATDASKPWATSVCLRGDYAYATNNVVLCRAPFPCHLPAATNLPVTVFDAIIAKGEPTALGADENSITFYFDDDVWIRSNLISGDWPTATVDGLVADVAGEFVWEAPHPELPLMLSTAVKLSDARIPVVEFTNGGLRLLDGVFEADELMPVPDAGKVNARMSALVFEHADGIRWHTPRQDVHSFRVQDIVGVFAGQR